MKCLAVDDAGRPAPRIEGRMTAVDPGARREELLSDSEATLRQVQGVLADFSSMPSRDDLADRAHRDDGRRANGWTGPGEVLVATCGEITSVIECLRQSCGMLEREAFEGLLTDIEDRLVELARTCDVPSGQALAERPRR